MPLPLIDLFRITGDDLSLTCSPSSEGPEGWGQASLQSTVTLTCMTHTF